MKNMWSSDCPLCGAPMKEWGYHDTGYQKCGVCGFHVSIKGDDHEVTKPDPEKLRQKAEELKKIADELEESNG